MSKDRKEIEDDDDFEYDDWLKGGLSKAEKELILQLVEDETPAGQHALRKIRRAENERKRWWKLSVEERRNRRRAKYEKYGV